MNTRSIILIILGVFLAFSGISASPDWSANWISHPDCQNATNTWLTFRKEITLSQKRLSKSLSTRNTGFG